MKIISLTLLTLLYNIQIQAQTDTKPDPRYEKFLDKVAASKGTTRKAPEVKPCANKFYKTFNDFLESKPVPDMELKGGRVEVMGSVCYEVTKNGESGKMKVKDLSTEYWGFCDRFGTLHRLFEKDAFLVLVAGGISQYVKTGQCTGTVKNDSTFALIFGGPGSNGGYLDYASAGVNGEIIKLNANLNGKSKELEKLMSAHPEIYKDLLADDNDTKYIGEKYRKRENLTFKIMHYIREYNRL